jgi:hypothetical protein
VPVLLCDVELTPTLRKFQWIDLSDVVVHTCRRHRHLKKRWDIRPDARQYVVRRDPDRFFAGFGLEYARTLGVDPKHVWRDMHAFPKASEAEKRKITQRILVTILRVAIPLAEQGFLHRVL